MEFYGEPLMGGPYPLNDAEVQSLCTGFPPVGGEVSADGMGHIDYMQKKYESRGGNNPVFGVLGLDKYPATSDCGDQSGSPGRVGAYAAQCANNPQYGVGCMNTNCQAENCHGDAVCGVGGVTSVGTPEPPIGFATKEGFLGNLDKLNPMCIIKWMLILLLGLLVISLICNNAGGGGHDGFDDLGGYSGEPYLMPLEDASATFVDVSDLF